jgi:hypothetical protein
MGGAGMTTADGLKFDDVCLKERYLSIILKSLLNISGEMQDGRQLF